MKDLDTALPPASVAVYVTVVSPTGNESPELWLDVNVTDPELSLNEGSVHDTVAVFNPGSVLWYKFSGILEMTGSSVSENYEYKGLTVSTEPCAKDPNFLCIAENRVHSR